MRQSYRSISGASSRCRVPSRPRVHVSRAHTTRVVRVNAVMAGVGSTGIKIKPEDVVKVGTSLGEGMLLLLLYKYSIYILLHVG